MSNWELYLPFDEIPQPTVHTRNRVVNIDPQAAGATTLPRYIAVEATQGDGATVLAWYNGSPPGVQVNDMVICQRDDLQTDLRVLGAAGNKIAVPSFDDLPDTPTDKANQRYKVPAVNQAESLLEYVYRSYFRGRWQPGTYYPQEWVFNGNLVAVVKDSVGPNGTQEQPVIIYANNRQWLTDALGGISWDSDQSATSTTLVVGLRLSFLSPLEFATIRFWLPANNIGMSAEIWYITNPLTNPSVNILAPAFDIDSNNTGAWVEVPVGSTLVGEGDSVDIIVRVRSIDGPTTFSGEWDYERTNNVPDEGKISHYSGGSEMRVNYTDKDSVDRETELLNMGIGDEILGGGVEWTITSVTFELTHVIFGVEPTTRAQNNTYTMQFTYYGAVPIDYKIDSNFYASQPNVGGIFSTTGYGNATITDHAYGIDAQFDPVTLPEDWDLFLGSGGSGGGGAATVPPRTNEIEYNWNTSTTFSDPGAGKISYSPIGGNVLCFNDIDRNGNNREWLIQSLKIGDQLVVMDGTTGTIATTYKTTSKATDNTGWWHISATADITAGTLTNDMYVIFGTRGAAGSDTAPP